MVQQNLSWDSHVNRIALKISRTIGIINKLKHFVPLNVLLTLYNSLVLPHMNYGLLIWGHRSERIFKLQKKAVRIISQSKYNSHSEPIFKTLKLLKIQDIYKLQQLKIIHKIINKSIPKYFETMNLIFFHDIHTHNTRHKNTALVPKIKHEFARNCIRYDMPRIMNNTSLCIVNKITTHSLYGYGQYIKKGMIESYSVICSILNCYIIM